MIQVLHALLVIGLVVWTGLPLAIWLFSSGEKSAPLLILHALVGGLLTLGLASQFCWQLGWNAHQAAWPFFGLASACNLTLGARVVWPRRKELARTETGGLAATGLVALLLLSVFAVSNGAPYYGRAWGDQINYSLIANFLQHQSPAAVVPYTRPAELVVIDSGLLNDRIGQSTLHAWLSELSGSPTLDSFYLVCIIGVLAFVTALYLTARTLGISPGRSALAALAAGLAPPLHAIHLESFLSQTMVTPVIFYTLVASFRYAVSGHCSWLFLVFLGATWVLTAYFEFFPILVVAELALAAVLLWSSRKTGTRVLWLGSAILAGLLLATWLSANPLELMLRGGEAHSGFDKFFPWAYQPEGFVRLLVGDWATQVTDSVAVALAVGVLVVTLGVAGHLLCFSYRRRHPLALSLAALLLLPLGVTVFPGDHSYQFYKLLQSFWPVTLIALVLPIESRPHFARRLLPRLRTIALGCAVPVLGSASFQMLATEANGQSARSGLSPYLRQNGAAALDRLVGSRPEPRIILNMPSRRSWNDLWVNGVLALQLSPHFHEIQAKWIQIGEHQHSQPVSQVVPADAAITDVRSIQPDFLDDLPGTLVLQVGSSFLVPAPRILQPLGAVGRLQLYRPADRHWLLASTVVGPEPGVFTEHDQGMVIHSRPDLFLRLDLESSVQLPDGVGLEITFEAPAEMSAIRWHVYSNTGYGTYAFAKDHVLRMSTGALRHGVTEIFFGPSLEIDPGSPLPIVSVKITRIVYGL